MVEKYC